MKLPIVSLTFVVYAALTIKADDLNVTCPSDCSCNSGTLSCTKISQYPQIGNPNPFASFMFSDCNMETLEKFPPAYENATDIAITRCGLSSISEDAFDNLKSLYVLVLSGNRLTGIPKGAMVAPKNLKELDLSDNRITNLPNEVFTSLPKLSTLVMDRNQLNFTENLFHGANLTRFTCNNCHLRVIPGKSLAKMKNLSQLELNENPFGTLQDNDFEAFKTEKSQIRELNLDNCSLSVIAKSALNPFGSLRILNLGHNELKTIPVGAFDSFMNSLEKLYLESNLLTTLDERLAPWTKLSEVKLGNNLWLCDCAISWIKSVDLNTIDKENITCFSPPQLQGQNLHEIESNMPCLTTTPSRYWVLGIGILAMIAGLAVTIFCVVKLCRSKGRGDTTVKYSQVYGETVTNSSKQSLVA